MALQRVSDLDGVSVVTDSTTLSLGMGEDNQTVSIDLSPAEYVTLRELLAVYFDNGVDITRSRPATNGTKPDTDAAYNLAVRTWAQTDGNLPEGVTVPAKRGRISKDVYAAFESAQVVVPSEDVAATK